MTKWEDYERTTTGQFNAAKPDASAWVSANAGSGKTKVLIDRVARLLLNGVKPDAILCVTYTKAAASEMQARLFKRLGGWCVADDGALAAELAELQKQPAASYTAETLGQARELFALALETPGGLRIETIHAFCGRLLRRFPLEAGIPPGFSEMDDVDADRLWASAIENLSSAIVETGDPELSSAAWSGALAAGAMGLADPIKSLTSHRARIDRFVASCGGIEGAIQQLQSLLGAPDQSVADLVDQAMTRDLPRDDLKSLLPLWLSGTKTDQKTGAIVETALLAKSAQEGFTAYKQVFLTTSGEFRKSDPYTKGTGEKSPLFADLLQIKSVPEGSEVFRMQTLLALISARETFERSAAILRLFDFVYGRFDQEKRRRGALDFDDLIEAASNLLTQQSASQWVLWKLDGGLQHVLLDEAQDTSPDQWRLLNALTQEFFSGQGIEREAPRTKFVVGDEKQSIYSFQGADPERFLQERQAFSALTANPDIASEMPDIQMSFRSAPEVLKYVDTVFNADQFDGAPPFSVTPPTDADQIKHLAFRRDHKGLVEFWSLDRPAQFEKPVPWDAPIGSDAATSPKATLAARIANWIDEQIKSGAMIHDEGEQRAVRPGDFLILVRTRGGGLFDNLIKALKRKDLPVAGADRIDLLESLPVQDCLNLIRFVLCPQDDLTLAEILTGPFAGLYEDKHLFPLANGRGDTSLWERLLASDDPDLAPIVEFLRICLGRSELPAYEFLAAALENKAPNGSTGWDMLQARLGPPAVEPITALLDRAGAFDARGPASLQAFLSAIEDTGGEVKRELSGPQDEVRVMTVHGSKGLEAPIVILPDTTSPPNKRISHNLFVSDEGGPIWSAGAKGDTELAARLRLTSEARALAEHRRLLYVALTRAQDRLLVCGAWFGQNKETSKGYAPHSWYDACRVAMEQLTAQGAANSVELTEDQTVHQYGGVEFSMSSDARKPDEKELAPDWLKRPVARETRQTRYASPTSLLKQEPAVLAPFRDKAPRRLERGRLIHTLLQTLPDVAETEWDQRAAHFLKHAQDFNADERQEMYEAALSILKNPQFANLFAPGSRAEAPIVGGNPKKLPEGVLINGRVDRLVVDDNTVTIVDFKTDRPAPARAEDVGAAYLAQMAAYRAVLESAYPGKQVTCALVWTDGPKLMELSSAMMDHALLDLEL